MAACAGPPMIDENCILAPVNNEGNIYYVGPCFDGKGKIDGVKVRWDNDDGISFRSVISRNNVLIQYRSEFDSAWLEWSSKTGLMLGAVPPEVKDALVDK